MSDRGRGRGQLAIKGTRWSLLVNAETEQSWAPGALTSRDPLQAALLHLGFADLPAMGMMAAVVKHRHGTTGALQFLSLCADDAAKMRSRMHKRESHEGPTAPGLRALRVSVEGQQEKPNKAGG